MLSGKYIYSINSSGTQEKYPLWTDKNDSSGTHYIYYKNSSTANTSISFTLLDTKIKTTTATCLGATSTTTYSFTITLNNYCTFGMLIDSYYLASGLKTATISTSGLHTSSVVIKIMDDTTNGTTITIPTSYIGETDTCTVNGVATTTVVKSPTSFSGTYYNTNILYARLFTDAKGSLKTYIDSNTYNADIDLNQQCKTIFTCNELTCTSKSTCTTTFTCTSVTCTGGWNCGSTYNTCSKEDIPKPSTCDDTCPTFFWCDDNSTSEDPGPDNCSFTCETDVGDGGVPANCKYTCGHLGSIDGASTDCSFICSAVGCTGTYTPTNCNFTCNVGGFGCNSFNEDTCIEYGGCGAQYNCTQFTACGDDSGCSTYIQCVSTKSNCGTNTNCGTNGGCSSYTTCSAAGSCVGYTFCASNSGCTNNSSCSSGKM